MITSPITSLLSKPKGKDDDARIPEWMLDYVRERGVQDIHSLILREFRLAGITQVTLAARLGHKKADQVCRYLRTPANWTIGTGAELLFAICGKLIGFRVIDPMLDRVSNSTTDAQPTNLVVVDMATHNQRIVRAGTATLSRTYSPPVGHAGPSMGMVNYG